MKVFGSSPEEKPSCATCRTSGWTSNAAGIASPIAHSVCVCAHTGHLSTSELGQEIMATYIKASKSRLNRAA